VSFDALTNVATFTPSTHLKMLTHYRADLADTITDLSGKKEQKRGQVSY